MKIRKLGILALALVLCLGLTGVGFAWWNETLTIGGTVATGELDVEFSNCDYTAGDYITVNCVLSNSDEDGDNDTATITIGNMYPCGTATCSLTVHNNGTIPLKILSVEITNENAQITVTVTPDPAGTELNPSETVTFGLNVHMEDQDGDEEENATYTFSAKVNVTQFNAP